MIKKVSFWGRFCDKCGCLMDNRIFALYAKYDEAVLDHIRENDDEGRQLCPNCKEYAE